MTLNEFLDLYPLPRNLKDVDEQSSGRNFHFLHSLNPDTLITEVLDSLDCANSFWNLPDINVQLTKFIDNWACNRQFNNRYSFGFVGCRLELMWIQEILLDKIDLKNKSHVIWLFNWCKERPSS